MHIDFIWYNKTFQFSKQDSILSMCTFSSIRNVHIVFTPDNIIDYVIDTEIYVYILYIIQTHEHMRLLRSLTAQHLNIIHTYEHMRL